MLRLILYTIFAYLIYRWFSKLLRISGTGRQTVHSGDSNTKQSLDLSKHDVEDADFEDIS